MDDSLMYLFAVLGLALAGFSIGFIVGWLVADIRNGRI